MKLSNLDFCRIDHLEFISFSVRKLLFLLIKLCTFSSLQQCWDVFDESPCSFGGGLIDLDEMALIAII